MYKLFFKLTLIFALACCFVACEKDVVTSPEKNPNPVDQDKGFEETDGFENDPKDFKLTVVDIESDQIDPFSLDKKEDPDKCNLPGCKSLIGEMKSYYQQLADQNCKTYSIGIHCCKKDGSPAYFILLVKPKKKYCDKLESWEIFEGS